MRRRPPAPTIHFINPVPGSSNRFRHVSPSGDVQTVG
jgi:hypothetical protein